MNAKLWKRAARFYRTKMNNYDVLFAELVSKFDSVRFANGKLHEENAQLREALEAVEWVDFDDNDDECPQCRKFMREGHTGDCLIGRALGRVR